MGGGGKTRVRGINPRAQKAEGGRWREPTGRRLKTLGAVDAGGEQRGAVRLGVALGDRAEAPTALRRVGR